MIAYGCLLLVAIACLAIQHAHHRHQDEAAADVWSALSESVLADLRAAERRAAVAEATVTALADDLATERRAHILTRTALVEAEGELIPLREVAAAGLAVVTAFESEVS